MVSNRPGSASDRLLVACMTRPVPRYRLPERRFHEACTARRCLLIPCKRLKQRRRGLVPPSIDGRTALLQTGIDRLDTGDRSRWATMRDGRPCETVQRTCRRTPARARRRALGTGAHLPLRGGTVRHGAVWFVTNVRQVRRRRSPFHLSVWEFHTLGWRGAINVQPPPAESARTFMDHVSVQRRIVPPRRSGRVTCGKTLPPRLPRSTR